MRKAVLAVLVALTAVLAMAPFPDAGQTQTIACCGGGGGVDH